jgi:hypothetical protein
MRSHTPALLDALLELYNGSYLRLEPGSWLWQDGYSWRINNNDENNNKNKAHG